jgi:tetratricopeptide (TPR) repeat protein
LNTPYTETNKTAAEKMADIIKANGKRILFFSVAVIVIIIFIGIFDAMLSRRNEKALVLAEEIEEVYNQWTTSAEADRDTVSEKLIPLLSSAFEDYSGTYAAMRAYYTKGLISAEEEKWSESIEAFEEVSNKFPETYLAPVALFNAASIADQSGDTEKALSLYEAVIDDFNETSADIPEILFNIGRLNEELGNADKALESYKEIVDNYNSSNWTNIAKSRIISINTNS